MVAVTALWGIAIAILAGLTNSFGLVLQKSVVNLVPPAERDAAFYKALRREKRWIVGVIFQLGLASVFYIAASALIGPTLTPSLMATGLIVLTIGSVRMNHESLDAGQVVGIALVILATVLLSCSGLTIPANQFDFSQEWFFVNALVYTACIGGLIAGLEVAQRRSDRWRGLLLTLITGLWYPIQDFYMSPFTGSIGAVFTLTASWIEWSFFLLGIASMVVVNIFAIKKTQEAFLHVDASRAIPLRRLPIQLGPILVYFVVFQLPAPNLYAVPFLLASTGLLLVASFLLAREL